MRSLAHGSQMLCAKGCVKRNMQLDKLSLVQGPLHAACCLLLHLLQSSPEPQQPALTAELLVACQPAAILSRAVFNACQVVSACSVCAPARVCETPSSGLRISRAASAIKEASAQVDVGARTLTMLCRQQRCCFRDPCVSSVAAPA